MHRHRLTRSPAFVPAALATCAAWFVASAATAQCPADLDNNGLVDSADLGMLLGNWGNAGLGDLDGDGSVTGADLSLVLAAWGTCPGVPSWATVVQYAPDPAVVTDPSLRAAIVAVGRPWRVRDTATQIELLLVPPGTFQMGCIMGSDQWGCYAWEQPVHTVTLTKPYYLGRYEVTQAQWTATMGWNPSSFQGSSDSPSRPVELMTMGTVQDFCAATGMRLPTEAEWEFACRAGTQTPFYNGSTDDGTAASLAWYGGNSGARTHAVGELAANALGFHDMLGNVWERVSDWYKEFTANAQTDPTSTSSTSAGRVIRGSCWTDTTGNVRSSFRSAIPDHVRADQLGFRVARTP